MKEDFSHTMYNNQISILLHKEILKYPDKKIICISGYPCTRKTTISKLLSKQKKIIIIPMENFIYSRIIRNKNHLSGCNPYSYNLNALLSLTDNFLKGNVIESSAYSWNKGVNLKSTTKITTKDVDYIVFDGTTSCILVDYYPNITQLLWFQPKNILIWIKSFIKRDLTERSYNIFESIIKNFHKAIDCISLYKTYKTKISYYQTILYLR